MMAWNLVKFLYKQKKAELYLDCEQTRLFLVRLGGRIKDWILKKYIYVYMSSLFELAGHASIESS